MMIFPLFSGWHSSSQDKVGLGSSLLGNNLLAQGELNFIRLIQKFKFF